MTLALAEALRQTSQGLKTRSVYYDWDDYTCCNVGILAQQITRMNQNELRLALRFSVEMCHELFRRVNWVFIAKVHQHTITPSDQVVPTILSTGFQPRHFRDLLYLDNAEICDRIGLPAHQRAHEFETYHRHPDNASDYMAAWADAIEEEIILGHALSCTPHNRIANL